MLITIYPNNEIRLADSRPTPPRLSDRNALKREQARLLDIRSQPSQPIQRKDFSRHPLSQKARHHILHLGGLFSTESQHRQLFLTGTLPGSTEQAILEFCRLAPLVSKLVQTYLPRSVGLKGSDLCYLWVWELQTRGALHMHLLVEFPSAAIAAWAEEEWGKVWRQALLVAQEHSDVDLFARHYGGSWADRPDVWQTDVKKVTGHVNGYLAKYLSKGGKGREALFPPRWYGASQLLRLKYQEYLKQNTISESIAWNPAIATDSLRESLAFVIQQFCGGNIKHKHSKFSDSAIDLFGYLKDRIPLPSVLQAIKKTMEPLIQRDVKASAMNARKMKTDGERELLEFLGKSCPYWFKGGLLADLPNATREAVILKQDLTRNNWLDVSLTLHWRLRAGGLLDDDAPVWAKQVRSRLKRLKELDEVIQGGNT